MAKLSNVIFTMLLGFLLVACPFGDHKYYHEFQFRAVTESPDIDVLDFQYGGSGQAGTRASDDLVADGRTFGDADVTGWMPRGEFLRVKWRVKQTGEIREKTVDLRKRLPANVTNYIVHFIVKDPELFIYLISPEPRPPTWPEGPIYAYRSRKVSLIYPDFN